MVTSTYFHRRTKPVSTTPHGGNVFYVEEKGPGHANIALQWSTQNPESEARALLIYMEKTGATAEEMYALIGVTDREYLGAVRMGRGQARDGGRFGFDDDFQG